MPRFSTYEYENKIKIERKKMSALIEFYDELKVVFPYLLAYSKRTEDRKEKINITANLEACQIMYNDAVKTVKKTRKVPLHELEEINDTLQELLTILQKYYRNLTLNGKTTDDEINPNF